MLILKLLKIVIGGGHVMKGTATKYVDFDPCTTFAKENMQISLCNSGKLLNVSICLTDICPDRCIIVGVLVCYKDKPYALETQQVILTSTSCKCCNCCCCCRDILVDGFAFIFPFEICRHEVTIKVVAHYIC